MDSDLRPGAFRRDGPETSRDAAYAIAAHAPVQRASIFEYIHARGADGGTDDEGEIALNIIPQSYTPRRGELVRAGHVIDSGQRRKTRRGRAAIVWRTVTQ
jgi:hypothetical protein